MKTIPLTKGKVALVDDADHEYLSQWRWCFSANSRYPERGYAVRTVNIKLDFGYKQYKIFMHRQVLGDVPGLQVDHVNGDGLDNRKANLRYATQQQNSANSGKKRSWGRNPSTYKGVHFNRKRGKWEARLNKNGRRYYGGLYADEEQAARAYDILALEHHGEFAHLNFT